MKVESYDSDVHERAIACVAGRLASFRLGLDAEDPFAYNDDELLRAGHIVGALWAQGLMTEKLSA